MCCTLSTVRQFGIHQFAGPINEALKPDDVSLDGDCGRLVDTTLDGHVTIH